jgi:hypothetical protein
MQESPRLTGTVNRKMGLSRTVFHYRRKTLNMDAVFSSEIFMSAYKTTQCHHPGDYNLDNHLQ